MFEDIAKRTQKKKTHKEDALEKEVPKHQIKPFSPGTDGFKRATVSLRNNFAEFLHYEVLNNPIQKKKLTEIIVSLLAEKYGKDFSLWQEERQ